MSRKVLSAGILLVYLLAIVFPLTASAQTKTVAHWRFQNVEGYYSGDLNGNNLTFFDLTGNGNDLEVKTVGFGDKLDIFKWYNAPGVGAEKAKSSLYFGNTLKAAKSVDPYDPSETTWTGAYTSGKYFNTVPTAPMNSMQFENGFTIEVIFCVDENFNQNYNRYCGIFSRNYIHDLNEEPTLLMSVAEASGYDADGYLGSNGTVNLQYVQINLDEMKTNKEFANGIGSGQWVHYMVTNDGDMTEVYVNGEFINTYLDCNGILCMNPDYGWEVGVGRKPGAHRTDHKNENPPEGTIRRLFCGAISEIRVSEGYMDVTESLYYSAPKYDLTSIKPEVVAAEPVADTEAQPIATTEAPAGQPAVAPATYDAFAIAMAAAAAAAGATFAIKKKRSG